MCKTLQHSARDSQVRNFSLLIFPECVKILLLKQEEGLFCIAVAMLSLSPSLSSILCQCVCWLLVIVNAKQAILGRCNRSLFLFWRKDTLRDRETRISLCILYPEKPKPGAASQPERCELVKRSGHGRFTDYILSTGFFFGNLEDFFPKLI